MSALRLVVALLVEYHAMCAHIAENVGVGGQLAGIEADASRRICGAERQGELNAERTRLVLAPQPIHAVDLERHLRVVGVGDELRDAAGRPGRVPAALGLLTRLCDRQMRMKLPPPLLVLLRPIRIGEQARGQIALDVPHTLLSFCVRLQEDDARRLGAAESFRLAVQVALERPVATQRDEQVAHERASFVRLSVEMHTHVLVVEGIEDVDVRRPALVLCVVVAAYALNELGRVLGHEEGERASMRHAALVKTPLEAERARQAEVVRRVQGLLVAERHRTVIVIIIIGSERRNAQRVARRRSSTNVGPSGESLQQQVANRRSQGRHVEQTGLGESALVIAGSVGRSGAVEEAIEPLRLDAARRDGGREVARRIERVHARRLQQVDKVGKESGEEETTVAVIVRRVVVEVEVATDEHVVGLVPVALGQVGGEHAQLVGAFLRRVARLVRREVNVDDEEAIDATQRTGAHGEGGQQCHFARLLVERE